MCHRVRRIRPPSCFVPSSHVLSVILGRKPGREAIFLAPVRATGEISRTGLFLHTPSQDLGQKAFKVFPCTPINNSRWTYLPTVVHRGHSLRPCERQSAIQAAEGMSLCTGIDWNDRRTPKSCAIPLFFLQND